MLPFCSKVLVAGAVVGAGLVGTALIARQHPAYRQAMQRFGEKSGERLQKLAVQLQEDFADAMAEAEYRHQRTSINIENTSKTD